MGNLAIHDDPGAIPDSCSQCGWSVAAIADLEAEYCPKCGIRLVSNEPSPAGETVASPAGRRGDEVPRGSVEEELFEQARSLPTQQRPEFLAKVCGDDPGLRRRLDELLAAADASDSMLDLPATENAGPAGDRAADASGTKIGNYKLLERIGEGGMGTVYLAEQVRPVKRMVALKVIRAGLDSKQVVVRFEAERQSLALMDHPNIAKVLDAGETETGEPYFVMELVKGLPITQYCDENRLSPKDRAELMIDVCSAVQHAHQKGIIHRDLKPSNLLVAQYDDRPVPKVIDFGVAKATHQKLTEKTLYTRLGQIVGTLEYMSPEQAVLNQLDVDTRSDVYSLGVILYELLVGETPLDGKDLRSQGLEQILRTIREKEPPRPSLRLCSQGKAATQTAAYRHTDQSTLSRMLRGDLDWIVMKALEKDRKRRYDSASRLADDLGNYLSGTAVEARPPSTLYRLQKTWQQNKGLISGFAAVVLVLLIGILATSWQRNKARESRQQVEEALQQVQRGEIVRKHDHFLYGLLRGQPDADLADTLIEEASDLGASEEWQSFHRGLAELFRQEYEDAIGHFQDSPEGTPNSISAKALLAISYMWAGDEYRYFEILNELSELTPIEFEDTFFMGYAFTWGDPRRAYELLETADTMSSGHQYVVFLRGVAARGRASIELTNLNQKKQFIDLATEDLYNSEKLMPVSALVLKELTLTHLHRWKIYQRLAAFDPANREQHLAIVAKAKSDAIALLPRLLANEKSSDVQYAVVMLLSELGPQDEMVRLAAAWQKSGLKVSLYPAQFLSLKLAAVGEHSRANYWLNYHGSDLPSQLTVETFVKLVDPTRLESISDLQAAARKRAHSKLQTGRTENLSFDVMSLMLLGDKSYLHHYEDDRLESLIGGGEAYKPMQDYFSRTSSKQISPQALIARCQDSPVPNASEMHANFYLAIQAIADRQWDDAESRLIACRDGDEFMFTVYFLSELLLAHWEQRETWADEWDSKDVDKKLGIAEQAFRHQSLPVPRHAYK